MCDTCDEITIPTGATGAAGTNGTNGTNGVKGDPGPSGSNGADGQRILSNFAGSYGNTVIAGTQTLKSYSVAANELLTNGDELELDIICAIDLVTSGTGTLSIQIGSNTSSITLVDVTTIRVNIKVSRIDASNILRVTQYLVDTGTTSTSRLINTFELFDTTIINPIYIKSVLSNNGIDQVIVNKFTVYKNKI